MNILLLGSGGREHALAWKMAQSHHCGRLYIAPGNAGTSQHGTNVELAVTDFDAQKGFCLENGIDMVVVGPEEPLVKGIYDYYKADPQLSNIVVVGPSAAAAQLEGSKTFSKQFMQRHQIPAAASETFTKENFGQGMDYIRNHPLPVVLKADGLAAGKGVVVCTETAQAQDTLREMLINEKFGAASRQVVVEAFLDGVEVSVFVLTDGRDYQVIGHAKDYKRIGEGDTGPNTGGMGCVTPVPFMNGDFLRKVEERIVRPTIRGLEKEKLIYNGFIFFGLMNCNGDPYMVEYNCRLGDPETEVVIPSLQTDLVSLFAAMDNGTLADVNISVAETSCATVMAVSGGYPQEYRKGLPVKGLPAAENTGQAQVFHAGTKKLNDGTVVTNGGRVLAVTSFGATIPEAVAASKAILEKISFEGMYYRGDIGFEFA